MLAIVCAWATLLFGELWFALQAFIPPPATRVAFEVVGVALFAYGQIRLAPEGPLKSPLLPAVSFLVVLSVASLDASIVHRLLAMVGAIVLLGLAVRGATRFPILRSAPVGVLASLATVVFVRFVLIGLAQGTFAQAMGVGSVVSTSEQLALELVRPLTRPDLTSRTDKPPVVLITIDTLRADHAVRMKSWERLAKVGRTWPRTMSSASWTLPAVASMHTGRTASEHGAGLGMDGKAQVLDKGVTTLAQQLDAEGYATAAVLTNAWLTRASGLARGFDSFDHINERYDSLLLLGGMPPSELSPMDGKVIVDRALAVLDDLPDEGFFLWVHLIDPHLPYEHATDRRIADAVKDGTLRNGFYAPADIRDAVRTAYAQEVDYADTEVMRLLDALEARGVLEDGLVILTSDHGEEFWDHGGVEHGHSHHTEVVDVGLVLAGRGVPRGEGVGVASLVDVAPTIRAFVGLPPAGHDLRQDAPPDRIVEAWGNALFRHARSARDAGTRVIIDGDPAREGRIHAYDVVLDPREHNPIDLGAGHPVHRHAERVAPPQATEAMKIDTAALQALGYIDE